MDENNIEQKKPLYKRYKREWLYILFGVGTTVVSWGSYAVFVGVMNMSVAVGNILSWICAVLFAFFTNKLFVFESMSFAPAVVFPELTKFFGTRMLVGVLEMVAVPFLVNIGFSHALFGAEGMWAKIAVSVLNVILNYIFSRLYVFKDKT